MASALYISFAIAAGGFRPALSVGGVSLPLAKKKERRMGGEKSFFVSNF